MVNVNEKKLGIKSDNCFRYNNGTRESGSDSVFLRSGFLCACQIVMQGLSSEGLLCVCQMLHMVHGLHSNGTAWEKRFSGNIYRFSKTKNGINLLLMLIMEIDAYEPK